MPILSTAANIYQTQVEWALKPMLDIRSDLQLQGCRLTAPSLSLACRGWSIVYNVIWSDIEIGLALPIDFDLEYPVPLDSAQP